MKLHLVVLCTAIVAILGFFARSSSAQQPNYGGALLYSMPWDTTVPPVDSTQPVNVQTAYLWLDQAMRTYPGYRIDSFINAMTWSDTAKTIASALYQIQDDNPLAYYMWMGDAIKPNPYKAKPGHEEFTFIKKSSHIARDTGRTAFLLQPEIIADVMVKDTFCKTEVDQAGSMNMILVNSTILDEIKGKKVPLCTGYGMKAGNKDKMPAGVSAWETFPVIADSGQCLQFEYSPSWGRVPNDDDGGGNLIDSAGGWWIKPGHEYIVFVGFMGIQGDTSNSYFSCWPQGGGTSGCMYPVVNGIVQDPWDDFGFGETNLTVANWKAHLRARINRLVNP